MVSKDKEGKNSPVPGLILTTLKEVSRFQHGLRQIEMKKLKEEQKNIATFGSIDTILNSKKYNIKVQLQ